MFLVGDAPPHMDYAQDAKYPDVVRMAHDHPGIIVNAVQACKARDTARVWRDIAQRSDGRYLSIPQDGGQIPFHWRRRGTRRSSNCKSRINGAVIPYGPRAQRSSVEQKTRQITSASPSVASEVADISNKCGAASGAAPPSPSVADLVGDVTAGHQKLDSVKDEDLPDTLRTMKPEQRQATIDKNMAENTEPSTSA